MKKSFKSLILLAVTVLFLASCGMQSEKKAKYVVYFIGDGMGFSHISLTEGYLATKEGKIGNNPLCFLLYTPRLHLLLLQSKSYTYFPLTFTLKIFTKRTGITYSVTPVLFPFLYPSIANLSTI